MTLKATTPPLEEQNDSAGDGWRLERTTRTQFNLWLNTDKQLGTRPSPYQLKHYFKLGWQAWYRGETVTGYLLGTLAEIVPALVEELKAGEVEDKLVPPRPRAEGNNLLHERSMRRWSAAQKTAVSAERVAVDEIEVERSPKGRLRARRKT